MKTIWALAFSMLMFNLNAATTKKLYVADHTVVCNNKSDDDCYLVKYTAKGSWSVLHTYIDSFDYSEGYEYQILVEVKKVLQPAAGQDSVEYVFRKLISKTKTSYSPEAKLAYARWYLNSLHADTNFINILDTTAIYFNLNVVTGTITGKLICNNANGQLKASGYNITISNIGTTKKACEGNAMEGVITGMLQEMERFTLKGNTLTFYSSANTAMVFKRYANIKEQ